jgi:FkbM family methyltransferase
MRLIRSAVSYLPNQTTLKLRHAKDLPIRLTARPHESDFEPLRALQIPHPIILDIGANRGQSIESFRAVVSRARIIAVEPNPMLATLLRHQYPDVSVRPHALGDAPGSFVLYIPRYGKTYWDTRASLDKHVAAAFLSPTHFALFDPLRAGIEPISVPVLTLDELGLFPHVVKIDAEGAEHAILRGAMKTLESRPILLLEGRQSEVLDTLVPFGYRPFHAVGRNLESGFGALNTFFLCERSRGLLGG